MVWYAPRNKKYLKKLAENLFDSENYAYLCVTNSKSAAQVAKLVDALVSGASAERLAGSTPVLGTKKERFQRISLFLCLGHPLIQSLLNPPLPREDF